MWVYFHFSEVLIEEVIGVTRLKARRHLVTTTKLSIVMVSDNDCYYPWTRTRCYILTCDDLLSNEKCFLGCNLTASCKLLMCSGGIVAC